MNRTTNKFPIPFGAAAGAMLSIRTFGFSSVLDRKC
jgi:hypothetical protein